MNAAGPGRRLSSHNPARAAWPCLDGKRRVSVVAGHVHAKGGRRRAAQNAHSTAQADEATAVLGRFAEEDIGLCACRPTRLGRGLVALSPTVLQPQTLVSIPIHNALVLSDDPCNAISVFGDNAQEAWQAQYGALPPDLLDLIRGELRWDVRLTAWLLWLHQRSRGGAGLWAQYMSVLPPEPDMSCLLNYDAAEAKELQVSWLIEEARAQHDWVQYLHTRWLGPGASGRLQLSTSPADTLWASAMVRSRTFSEEVGGEGVTLMVPFADMANHSQDHNATFCVSRDRQSFELRAVQRLAAGDEVLISYGDDKPNAELMRDYGFVIPGNPSDRIPLPGQGLYVPEAAPSSAGDGGDQGAVGKAGPQLLNGASLVEAAGMQGGWMDNQLVAASDAASSPAGGCGDAQAVWVRRASAVLSLPLTDGYQGVGGALNPLHGGRQEPPPNASNLFGWAQPWTASGKPSPRKLRSAEVPRERAAVAEYAGHWAGLLAGLPTTAGTDVKLLLAPSQRSRRLTPRRAAAIRARLEFKRLLLAGLEVLSAYDAHLAASTHLSGSRR